jgi:PhzF family phenazine biosynthesis protein
MSKSFFIVDAFAREPFRGNPAAVVLLTDAADDRDAWMQSVATEFNLSETAFVYPQQDGSFRLRWFTPAFEVDLCGHATLAAASVLWKTETVAANDSIHFETRSGRLTAKTGSHPDAKQGGPLIELDFPVTPVNALDDSEVEAAVHGCFSCDGQPLDWQFIGQSTFDLVLKCSTERQVHGVQVNYRRLGQLDFRGAIVTARGDQPAFDIVSRFFAPKAGVDEDPVTGSAHCALIDYWGRKLNRDELTAWQASQRGGAVRMKRSGDRVTLGGYAVQFCAGQLE